MRYRNKGKRYAAWAMIMALVSVNIHSVFAADNTISACTAACHRIKDNALSEVMLQDFEVLIAERAIEAVVFHDGGVLNGNMTDLSQEGLESGEYLQLLRPFLDEQGVLYYYVDCDGKRGYLDRYHIACEDERLLDWERRNIPADTAISSYINAAGGIADEESVTGRTVGSFEEQLLMDSGVSDFPEDYQELLSEISKTYPGWQFVKKDVGVKWEEAVTAELENDRSLIEGTADAAYVNKAVSKGGGWYLASKAGVEYYMDPRHYLDVKHIFAFETMTYNASYQTEEVVQKLLNSTFMSGMVPGSNQSYANAFYQIGSDTDVNVNPIFLAARVKQEQSASSKMISGTYTGYEGYYNYFNIQAIGTGDTAIQNGLRYASSGSDYERPWNTRYKSLKGGAKYLSELYIKKGQNTLYLQKYNLAYKPYYNHQYMQNIRAPYFESATTYAGYNAAGILSNSFVFVIPVFSDMTEAEKEKDTKEVYAQESEGVIEDKVCRVAVCDQKGEKRFEVTVLSGTAASDIPDIFQPVSLLDGQVLAGYFADTAGRGLRVLTDTTIENDLSVYPVIKTLTSKVTVLPVGAYTYTGKAIYPSVSVYDGRQLLIKGVDYKLTYHNNKNVSEGAKTPTIVIKGIGRYAGTRYESFSILPRSLESSRVRVKPSMLLYNGKSKQLSPVVYYDGKALRKGRDYAAVYTPGNYTDIGVYKVNIKGIMNYSGTLESTQVVSDKIPVTKCKIKIPKLNYNGNSLKVSPEISFKGETLTENIHYKIIYPVDMTSAGVKTIFVKGVPEKGYFGSKAIKVTVKGGSLAGCKVNRLSPVPFSISGNNIPDRIEVTDKMGNVLKQNRDYRINFKDNDGVGTGSIILTGINGYTGTAVKKYKITGPVPEKIKRADAKPIG